jgi:hypothetical protein
MENEALTQKIKSNTKLEFISSLFPQHEDSFIEEIYHLNLEQMEAYSCFMGYKKVFQAAASIHAVNEVHSKARYKIEAGAAELIYAAYRLFALLHKKHKKQSSMVYASGISDMYAMVINEEAPFGKPIYKADRIDDKSVKQVALNALAYSSSLGRVASDKDFKKLLKNLEEHFTISEQVILLTRLNYEEILEFHKVPNLFIDRMMS